LLCVGILLVVLAVPTKQTSYIDETGTDLEQRLETILSQIEGCGEVHVMITEDNRKNVQGVAISAQGGNQATVVKEISDVVQALFGIEMHKIKVMKGK
jgi:stage III sporulation protein AG